jgi:hypothetical protein
VLVLNKLPLAELAKHPAGRSSSRSCPPAVNNDKHGYEAVAAVEEIFRKRGIDMEHLTQIAVESDNSFN